MRGGRTWSLNVDGPAAGALGGVGMVGALGGVGMVGTLGAAGG
jgi:hypothetical protein